MNEFLFNTDNGQYGLAAFQQNLVKVCIEDKEFFNENWETINPNDYADCDVRALLNFAKELKRNGIDVTYDNLKFVIGNKIEGVNKVVYIETLDALKDVELSVEEAQKIKETYMYFGLYASMVSQANMVLDWAKTGFKYGKQVIDMYEKTQVGMERNNALYNRLLTVLEDSRTHNNDNSWNE